MEDDQEAADGNAALQRLADSVLQELALGRSIADVADAVAEATGWTRSQARQFTEEMSKALEDAQRQQVRRRSVGDLLWGLVWLGVGLGVSIGTYQSADPGDSYVIAWGAILVGAVGFLVGLIRFLVGRE